MAFVYRTPRNLQQPHEVNKENEVPIQEKEEKPRNLSRPPQKGLPCLNNKSVSHQLLSNKKLFEEIINDSSNCSKKPVPEKKQINRVDYFFRSKQKREVFERADSPVKEECNKYDDSYCSSKSNPKAYLFNKQNGKMINLLEAKRKVGKVEKSPSIPGKIQKFGYVAKGIQQGLRYPHKVSRPKYDGIDGDTPGPGEYTYDLKPKPKGIVKYSKSQKQKLVSETLNNQFFALISDQEARSLHNEKLKDWVKKPKKEVKEKFILKRSPEVKTRQKSEYSDSDSGVTVYDDDTTPGPGYYQQEERKKKDFRSKKKQFKKIFFNQSPRFEAEKESESIMFDFLDPAKYKIEKRNNFYISKLKREMIFGNERKESLPEYYDTRKSIENDIISKVLRNSPKLFNNGIPRIPNGNIFETPGPGYYNSDIPKFKVDSVPACELNSPERSIQKESPQKKFEVNENEHQNQLLKTKGNNVASRIHVRKDEVIESENLCPFGSTCPKWKEIPISNIPHTYESPRKASKVQNKAAFNVSKGRESHKKREYIAEVGLYDIGSLHSWATETHNILFN